MKSPIVPYLCGGTFFCLLLQVRRERNRTRNSIVNETDGLSDVETMKGLLHVVMNSTIDSYDATFKKNVSQYKTCQKNGGVYIPLTDEVVITNFDDAIKNKNSDTLKRMSEFVDEFLNLNLATWLVSALLEFIEKDSQIPDNAQFFIEPDMPITKKELLEKDSFEFQPFLLAVLHYIILNRRENKKRQSYF
ncbi:MAG: hypothetical protein IK062_11815 [Selenomonadaceae bacterium]|nr:hypothetical protein [Selenomonadaceae bacterium]